MNNIDVNKFKESVDTVIQNPPFGTKIKHSDREFLINAFQKSNVIHTIHKITSKKFIEQISKDYDFKVTHYKQYNLSLKNTMKMHIKPKKIVQIGCWRLEKIGKPL